MDAASLKHEAWHWAMTLWHDRLNAASSGNFSLRAGEVVAVTPSGVRYDELTEDRMVLVDLSGRILEGGKPSVETGMHLRIYRLRPEAGAVAHTHAPHTIALAALGEPLPMIALEGLCAGSALVPVTEGFQRPGSPELADAAERCLCAEPALCAVLLRSHGLLTLGKTAREAVSLAESLEVEAEAYLAACARGTPARLSEETRQAILCPPAR